MGRRAANEGLPDEATYLTPSRLVPGVVIVLDLDSFEEVTRERGYDEYKPNDVTGTLSALVEDLARRWAGVVVYGLDWERGTEEALIEIPYVEADEVAGDLVAVAEEVASHGVTVTIVALDGYVEPRAGRGSRRGYHATPFRRRALSELRKWKRRGGGFVVVNGSVVWRAKPLQ